MPSKSNQYKPTTAGRRGMTRSDFSMLTKKPSRQRSLTKGSQRSVGRSSQGRITTRHRSTGGVKRLLRVIDWQKTTAKSAVVKEIVYDPNRTARLALIEYDGGQLAYIIAGEKMKVGQKLYHGEGPLEDGNTLPIKNIASGLLVHGIELRPGQGAKLARAAGTYGIIQGADQSRVQVKLSSGKTIWLHGECLATIGAVSNSKHATVVIGKAGRQRKMGRRPVVRGKAMNPDDHPHGGGEGGTGIGLKGGPKTKWGAKALGVKTRRRKTNLIKI